MASILVSLLFFIADIEAAEKDAIEFEDSIGYTGDIVTIENPVFGKEMYTEEFRNRVLNIFIIFDEDTIEFIMENGYDVFSTGIWNELIRLDSVMTIKYLLKNHFKDPRIRERTFRDALFHGSESIAKVLIDNYKSKVKPESEVAQAYLVEMAYERKFYSIIEKMAKEFFNVNYILPSNRGRSILHDAVISGDSKMIKLLLKFNNINLNIRDELGNSPLHYAKNIKIFLALIENYANPFLKNELGINSIFMTQPSVTSRFELFNFTLKNAVSEFSIRTFVINRERVLEDSFYLASRELNWFNLNSCFDINFAGENGIDRGGLKREWMSLLTERFFVPNEPVDNESKVSEDIYTLSTIVAPRPEGTVVTVDALSQMAFRDLILMSTRVYAVPGELYYGAPFECVDSTNKFYRISSRFTGPVEVYRFIGSIMAKSLLMKVPLKVKLVPSIIKLLLGKTLDFQDLKDDDPVMFNSMIKGLESGFEFVREGSVEGFFEETAVNAMYTRYKDQLDLFIEGFHLILNEEMIGSFFSHLEFQEILCGSEEFSRSDLQSNIKFVGKYWSKNSEMFWNAMDLLSERELYEFVRFVTGINGLPFGGFASLGKKITIHDEPLHTVPKAYTCTFHLNIPISITNSADLLEMFRFALNSGPEFTY